MAIVTLYDIDEDTLSRWAITNCYSFVSWLIYENSEALSFIGYDDEAEWYIRYEFEFTDEQEALLFQMKWQGQ
jgi:hypothetical protein